MTGQKLFSLLYIFWGQSGNWSYLCHHRQVNIWLVIVFFFNYSWHLYSKFVVFSNFIFYSILSSLWGPSFLILLYFFSKLDFLEFSFVFLYPLSFCFLLFLFYFFHLSSFISNFIHVFFIYLTDLFLFLFLFYFLLRHFSTPLSKVYSTTKETKLTKKVKRIRLKFPDLCHNLVSSNKFPIELNAHNILHRNFHSL